MYEVQKILYSGNKFRYSVTFPETFNGKTIKFQGRSFGDATSDLFGESFEVLRRPCLHLRPSSGRDESPHFIVCYFFCWSLPMDYTSLYEWKINDPDLVKMSQKKWPRRFFISGNDQIWAFLSNVYIKNWQLFDHTRSLNTCARSILDVYEIMIVFHVIGKHQRELWRFCAGKWWFCTENDNL